MALITLDFETYYAPGSVTLKKLTYEEYVRHPEFEVLMCGFVTPYEKYCIVNHKDAVFKELERLELNKHTVNAHNTAFDGLIVGDYYGLSCGQYACTQTMARPFAGNKQSVSLKSLAELYGLPAKLDEIGKMAGKHLKDFDRQGLENAKTYCTHDAWLCGQLYNILKNHFSEQDLRVISMIMRMNCEPIFEWDVPLLQKYLPTLKAAKQVELRKIAKLIGHEDASELASVLKSSIKFAKMLNDLGYPVPLKDSPKQKNPDGTPKRVPALAKGDAAFKAMLDSDDDLLRTICETRVKVNSNIAESRTQRLIDIGLRGKSYFPLGAFATVTTRLAGGGKINPQNMPNRGKDRTIRHALQAPKGFVILACDLSQIEARWMAFNANQLDLLEAFRLGRDVYIEFAIEIYHRLITAADKRERSTGKEGILSLQFGAGWRTFRTRLYTTYNILISEELAQHTVAVYKQRYPDIVAYWSECEQALQTMMDGGTYRFGLNGQFTAEKGKIILPDGWEMIYDDIHVNGKNAWGFPQIEYLDRFEKKNRIVTRSTIANNTTQGPASRIIQYHMDMIERDLDYPVITRGNVHDELIFVVPENEVEQAAACVSYWMSTAPGWAGSIPIKCEVTVGKNYGEQMKVEEWLQMH